MNLPKAAMPTPMKAGNRKNSTGQCSNCGVYTLHFLHQVRCRGIQRRLCTSCVLRLHPTSFCSGCFAFYDGVPPHPSKRLSCSKCASFTHTDCAATSPLSPYLCTPCNNSSSFSFFHQTDRINKKQAVVLLCAARIAASSMSKAAALAKEEAERKVKEAACARKRAREALEHLVWVSNEESARRQEETWNGKNNGVAVANAKDEEMEDGDFESLVRHLENTLVKEEVVDVAI